MSRPRFLADHDLNEKRPDPQAIGKVIRLAMWGTLGNALPVTLIWCICRINDRIQDVISRNLEELLADGYSEAKHSS